MLNRLNKGARIAICGAISQYNAASKDEIFAPKNYMSLLVNSASMRGFVVFDFASQYKEAVEKLKGWLSQGKIVSKVHIVDDLGNAAEALQMLFDGRNDGKLIVRIDPSAAASEAVLLGIRAQSSKL